MINEESLIEIVRGCIEGVEDIVINKNLGIELATELDTAYIRVLNDIHEMKAKAKALELEKKSLEKLFMYLKSIVSKENDLLIWSASKVTVSVISGKDTSDFKYQKYQTDSIIFAS